MKETLPSSYEKRKIPGLNERGLSARAVKDFLDPGGGISLSER